MNKKCLIIDDVEVSRYVISEAVQGLGFQPQEAEQEAQAMQLLRKEHFDVIFLDWHLRKQDGLALIPEIRAISGAQNTPIVVCTGVEMDKDLNDIKNSGAQGFLKKPTDPATVKAELVRLSLI